jgi:CheY-like chemotaxis protein
MHGGTIAVASEFGKGSTFTLSLPLLRRVNTSDRPRLTSSPEPDEAPVLVVEDDANSAELLAGHLQAAGIPVTFAANGDEALRLASELQPKAITLDLQVPGDGWTILRRLKDSPTTREIPVLIVSVVDETTRGLAMGATAYLVKPVAREALVHSLESMGVQTRRVAGANVLLVGEDSAPLRDIWEHLHQIGCKVERVMSVSRPLTKSKSDVALIVESADGATNQDTLSFVRSLAVPVVVVGSPEPSTRHDVILLGPNDVSRPERIVQRLREALDRGPTPSRRS